MTLSKTKPTQVSIRVYAIPVGVECHIIEAGTDRILWSKTALTLPAGPGRLDLGPAFRLRSEAARWIHTHHVELV